MLLARRLRITRVAHPLAAALATTAEGALETLGEIQMDDPVVDAIDVLAGANTVGVTAQHEALLMKALPKATPGFKSKALGLALLVSSVITDGRKQIQAFAGNPAKTKTTFVPLAVDIGPTDGILPFKRMELVRVDEVKMASTFGHGVNKLIEEDVCRVVEEESLILIATKFKKNIFGVSQDRFGLSAVNDTGVEKILNKHFKAKKELRSIVRGPKMDRPKLVKFPANPFMLRRDNVRPLVVFAGEPFNITSHGIFKETSRRALLHLRKFAGINVPLVELDDKKPSKKAVPPR